MMKMKTLLPLSAALLAFTSPVWAEDARLVTHMYDSDEVVHIDGKLGVQATIGFGPAGCVGVRPACHGLSTLGTIHNLKL